MFKNLEIKKLVITMSNDDITQNEDQLNNEDIFEVIEDDEESNAAMSEDPSPDHSDIEEESKIVFEDDSIQGFFSHKGKLYFLLKQRLYLFISHSSNTSLGCFGKW